jgi:stage II sporulation protein AB (anti-sigma F factor)
LKKCRRKERKMKPLNEMRLKIESRSVNEAFGRSVVAAFAAQLDPNIEEISDIRTAVSEAVTNCIVHAYANTVGPIYIWSGIYENGVIKIKIRDTGCGIEDVRKAMEPLYTTLGGERAGLGFAVMESFCDKVKVSSKKGVGTVVTLEKKIKGRDTDA